MNLENFVVRPKRRLVEKYAKAEAWVTLPPGARSELAHEVAGLPSELDPENEEAKRFDLLLLNLQLAVLKHEPSFERLRNQVMELAGALGEKDAIPMVHAQMPLLLDLQTEEWWQDVTVPMLESVRRRVRSLVQFIDKRSRKPLYTDFEDVLGPESEYEVIPGASAIADFEKFKAKARAFLRSRQDHATIQKLRLNKPLTVTDLSELERMLVENEVGGPKEIERAKQEAHGLGIFVRSLVGLDRSAAKDALGTFLDGKRLSASQIEFVDMIVNHLTEHGIMEAALLYESPFTDLTPHGPNGLFEAGQVDELMAALDSVRQTAVAA